MQLLDSAFYALGEPVTYLEEHHWVDPFAPPIEEYNLPMDLDDTIMTPEQIDALYHPHVAQPDDPFACDFDNVVVFDFSNEAQAVSFGSQSAPQLPSPASVTPQPLASPKAQAPEQAPVNNDMDEFVSSDSEDEDELDKAVSAFTQPFDPFLKYTTSSFLIPTTFKLGQRPHTGHSVSGKRTTLGTLFPPSNKSDWDAESDGAYHDHESDSDYEEHHMSPSYSGGRQASSRARGHQVTNSPSKPKSKKVKNTAPKSKPYDSTYRSTKVSEKPNTSGRSKGPPKKIQQHESGLYLGAARSLAEYMQGIHPDPHADRDVPALTSLTHCVSCGIKNQTPRRHLATDSKHGGKWFKALIKEPASLIGEELVIVTHMMLASTLYLDTRTDVKFTMIPWTEERAKARDLFLSLFEDISLTDPRVHSFSLVGEYAHLLKPLQHWAKHQLRDRTCHCGKIFSRPDCIWRCKHGA